MANKLPTPVVEFIAHIEEVLEGKDQLLTLLREPCDERPPLGICVDTSNSYWLFDLVDRYASTMVSAREILYDVREFSSIAIHCEYIVNIINEFDLPVDIQEAIQRKQASFQAAMYVMHFSTRPAIKPSDESVWSQMPIDIEFDSSVSWEYAELFKG